MVQERLIIGLRDFSLLEKHLKTSSLSKYNAQKLFKELESAEIIKDKKLPEDVVCLNSIVEIEEKINKKTFTFQLVLPGEADMRKSKISVFTPMGVAVLGYRVGATIDWEMPNGIQRFEILKVCQDDSN